LEQGLALSFGICSLTPWTARAVTWFSCSFACGRGLGLRQVALLAMGYLTLPPKIAQANPRVAPSGIPLQTCWRRNSIAYRRAPNRGRF